MKTRDIVLIGLFAAIICVFAPYTIPVGDIPITLATFAIYLAAAVLGAKKGTIAVFIYILIGLIGLPVFSGFSGGIGKIAGYTGGYLIGYIPCVFISGAIIDRFSDKKTVYPIALIAGTAALYTFGTIWYMVLSGNSLKYSLMACVVPFLLGDAIKIAAASVIAANVRAYAFGEAFEK
ncbi:biotin transporter BioY [Clostridiales bacterium]|nr:biotin transporter BioY [Clostridiales bacterium]